MLLALNLEKPKENQCFCFPRASGDPGGTIGPTTPKKLYITNSRSTAQAAIMLTHPGPAPYRQPPTS